MLANLSKIKPIWALAIIASMVLVVVAGCISTERTVKQPKDPVETVQFGSSPLQIIGQKIYNNETGGDVSNLIFWSTNEGFASLGVGHFIWYPQGKIQRFKQTFPDMIRYLKSNGSDVPDWLLQQIEIGSLWNSREELEQSRGSEKFLALQKLLIDTSGLQVSFLFQRLDKALPRILTATNQSSHELITRRFNRLKNSPGGLYPLVDYVNFKGEGSVPAEGYKGEGWGLLQVLETMEDTPAGPEALVAFSVAADKVLTRRVSNSPLERNEQRWLPGWRVRLMTYTL
jgi:hypothetical protein